MGQSRTYCLSAGTTSYYESQFKSRGGTISCTLNSDKDGDDDETPLDDDGSADVDDDKTDDKTDDETTKPCPKGQQRDKTGKCVSMRPCPPMYYSKTGYAPCQRCAKGTKTTKSGSTSCVKAGAGTDTDDDPKGSNTYVSSCQQYNANQAKCTSSYTRTNGKQDDCSYCTGSLMGQSRSYCLSAGTTSYYESQFKSRGGTISCTLNSDKDGDDDKTDGETTKPCPKGQKRDKTGKCVSMRPCPVMYYSKTGYAPCQRCAKG